MFQEPVTSVEQLRDVISLPGEPALRKEISYLDEHCRELIARSPFLLLGTSNARGQCDVSPKGDVPGFVTVLDDQTLIIPDRPGNHRADSLRNIIENPHVGLLFIIPGVEWTLRINGGATIARDASMRDLCAVQGKAPELVIGVRVEEAYLHCPKCFIRSGLWDDATWMAADEQPNFAQFSRDMAGYQQVPLEIVEKGLAASNADLY
ncbi:MAG TPA: MSMEG_1061 family FMN-dependent PPOX-type flavoprotein [Dehalococcoidia bacterium]|nr:MSMEG_1061 family FMN-dependent PPOX-type flavoprotein [Dehalococcoidia bacterium]